MSELRRPGLIGARVPRTNDARLLVGGGRFVDDIVLPGMLHAVVLRSPIAAGRLTRMDHTAASAMPGVHLVFSALDEHGLRPLSCVWTQPGQLITSYDVLTDVITYVGQELAIVVAETRELAEDAMEVLDYEFAEAEAVVVDPVAAAEGGPVVHPALGTNVVVEIVSGDPLAEVDEAIAGASHVVSMSLDIPRVIGRPIETRGIVASWDSARRRLEVWNSTQSVHHVREVLGGTMGLSADQIGVVAGDVGGGFGVKEHLYPDEILACEASRRLGRPVKWIEDRVESFTASLHARAQYHQARLALDDDGTFVALWTDLVHDQGAHPSNVGPGPSIACMGLLPGPYKFGVAGATTRCVTTNRTPTGAYRGFGMQQAAWVRERLIDEAARQIGIDPVELRLQNMIRANELPYTTPFLHTYDSGDYPRALEELRDMTAQWSPDQSSDGRLRGIGYASFVEFTGLGPTKMQQILGFHLNGFESSVVRIEPDGSATVLSGAASIGQGIETSLAQIAADNLGLPIERVSVVLGDSDAVPYSSAGSIASRAMTVAGGALVRSSVELADKIKTIAAHQLEASVDDIELVDESARVRGTPASAISLASIADSAWMGWDLPDGTEPGLEARATYDPPDITYSYASHAAAVAVDPDTGHIEVEKYWVVHDAGVIVNPMIADGQVQGGVAQGISMAIFEDAGYDERGQPQQASFVDYLLASAEDVPDISIGHIETPSLHTPGGMKGLGEGGLIPVPAAIANALCNAVPRIAASVTETPLSAHRVWQLLQDNPGR